jgi:hypothetical protein
MVMAPTVIEPELLAETVWTGLASPTATLPKFKLVGATVRSRATSSRLEPAHPPQVASNTPSGIA